MTEDGRTASHTKGKPYAASGGRRRFSPDRFRSLALLCLQSDVDPRYLYSAMFRADMEAYRLLGKSITGTTWVKTGNGVEPRPPRARRSKEVST